MKKFKVEKEEGITLVALVVTIVVLLILAGISLNLVLGQNGIITKAKEAREKSDEATTNTELFFNSTVDEIDKIIGDNNTSSEKITDEEFKKNPTNYKHEKQEKSDNVGIGTDGKPVNMDLWTYEIWWNNTVCLSAIEGSYNGGPGYQNYNVTAEGTIEGTVPRLIYDSKTDQVLPVTSMQGTFYNCTNLVTAPEIPDTVTDMEKTFYGCTSLKKASTIPNSVTDMTRAFEGCTSLEEAPVISENMQFMNFTFAGCKNLTKAPVIPESVTYMPNAFDGCVKLTTAPAIPGNVTNIDSTFNGCTSLTTVPEAIPENVEYMGNTFFGCTNLTGTIIINAKLSSYSWYKEGCFSGTVKPIVIKGSSQYLADLAATAENGNVTVEQ